MASSIQRLASEEFGVEKGRGKEEIGKKEAAFFLLRRPFLFLLIESVERLFSYEMKYICYYFEKQLLFNYASRAWYHLFSLFLLEIHLVSLEI